MIHTEGTEGTLFLSARSGEVQVVLAKMKAIH